MLIIRRITAYLVSFSHSQQIQIMAQELATTAPEISMSHEEDEINTDNRADIDTDIRMEESNQMELDEILQFASDNARSPRWNKRKRSDLRKYRKERSCNFDDDEIMSNDNGTGNYKLIEIDVQIDANEKRQTMKLENLKSFFKEIKPINAEIRHPNQQADNSNTSPFKTSGIKRKLSPSEHTPPLKKRKCDKQDKFIFITSH